MMQMSKRKVAGVVAAAVLGAQLWASAVPVYAQEVNSLSETPTHQVARTTQETLADWEAWTRDHAYRLETIKPVEGKIEPGSFKDLDMLKPLLHDKRIVFLGESSHGVAEFNQAKTRLIQYLHEEMGYNVLAFESGLSNSSIAYGNAASQSAEQTMKDSIFGVWWSKEILPLFNYLKDTQTSENPLMLTGFDIQMQFPLMNGKWLQDAKQAERLKQAEEKLAAYAGGTDLEGYQKDKNHLMGIYNETLRTLKAKGSEEHIKALYPSNPALIKQLERSLQDRIRAADEYVELSIKSNRGYEEEDYAVYAEYLLKSMEWRDQAMQDNLIWLATEVYPNEKFIVWGHNDHIQKAHSEVMGTYYPVKQMGELLPEEWKKYSYVLGLYPVSGKTADNTGAIHDVLPLEEGSIESIVSKASQSPYTFIDLKYRNNERGNSWMFEPRYTYSWGMIPESLVTRDQYDGLLLIDNVHPPQYIRNHK
ncbi:erythromycin esterase [Paenibacillus sp. 79R4]|uniref:erythromycin esterase family protein n=1 Tax=Paenibacillus sp. 79R4 TaxID=2212847 RepID=UPI0015BD458E|nr:erythromycin esterase family protein [Paenibacillus sp. 79R4]NWL86670.1 erythromycin esterase [Paenibacillus sp. 79R4]